MGDLRTDLNPLRITGHCQTHKNEVLRLETHAKVALVTRRRKSNDVAMSRRHPDFVGNHAANWKLGLTRLSSQVWMRLMNTLPI
jgi:hypothetical protein